jgi:hypothetical protein
VAGELAGGCIGINEKKIGRYQEVFDFVNVCATIA